jgi:hypothetical protein
MENEKISVQEFQKLKNDIELIKNKTDKLKIIKEVKKTSMIDIFNKHNVKNKSELLLKKQKMEKNVNETLTLARQYVKETMEKLSKLDKILHNENR